MNVDGKKERRLEILKKDEIDGVDSEGLRNTWIPNYVEKTPDLEALVYKPLVGVMTVPRHRPCSPPTAST